MPGGTLVVAADHEGARELTRRLAGSVRTVTYGESQDADVRILSVVPQGLKSEVTVDLGGSRLTFTVSVPGRHYAHNAVAALAAGVALGVPPAELASALGAYTGVKRRLQLKGEESGVQVIDSYAHTPTEMTADLEAMRAAAGEARILVLFQPTCSPAPRSWARRWVRRSRWRTPRWSWTSTRPVRTRSPGDE